MDSLELRPGAGPLTFELNTALRPLVSPGHCLSFVYCQVMEEGAPVYITQKALLMSPGWSVYLAPHLGPRPNACTHTLSQALE